MKKFKALEKDPNIRRMATEVQALFYAQKSDTVFTRSFRSWYELCPEGDFHYKQYPSEEVLGAVYSQSQWVFWQVHRVAMKGLPTRDKLLLLNWHMRDRLRQTPSESRLVHIRVCNYLGALKRAGILDENLIIEKER